MTSSRKLIMVARMLMVVIGLLPLAGCESTLDTLIGKDTMPDSSGKWNAPYPDNISRNATAVEGSSLHDPRTFSPPPVRKDYAFER